MDALHDLLAEARAQAATAKIVMGQLIRTVAAHGKTPDQEPAYLALTSAISTLDGTLALDSQALLGGSDPTRRAPAITAAMQEVIKAQADAQQVLHSFATGENSG